MNLLHLELTYQSRAENQTFKEDGLYPSIDIKRQAGRLIVDVYKQANAIDHVLHIRKDLQAETMSDGSFRFDVGIMAYRRYGIEFLS